MRRVKRTKEQTAAPFFEEGGVSIHHGDMREVLAGMEPESFTACVTDPPYHLTQVSRRGSPRKPGTGPYGRCHVGEKGFMGKTWDGGGIAFDPETWKAVLRVLKPGGILMAFGGTRTFHRMACAVEDAGFEVRDTLMWLQGQGFPKNKNISKAIDKVKGVVRTEQIGPSYRVIDPKKSRPGFARIGRRDDSNESITKEYFQTAPATPQAALWQGYGSALKPAFEPIILAMKPLDGTFAGNALKHGVAGINVDGGRVGTEDVPAKVQAIADAINSEYQRGREGEPSANRRYADRGSTNISATPGPRGGSVLGRWPANVILSHSPDCVCVGQSTVGKGARTSNKDTRRTAISTRAHNPRQPNKTDSVCNYGEEQVEVWACVPGCPVRMLDEQSGFGKSGVAVRRHKGHSTKGHVKIGAAGLNDANMRDDMGYGDTGTASRFFYTAKASTSERSVGIKPGHGGNRHPTVKPVSLMRYLLKLVRMPSNTRILDPFCGSGSTLVAGVLEGVDVVGVEMDEQSCGWSRDRVKLALEHGEGYSRIKKFRLKRRRKVKARRRREG